MATDRFCPLRTLANRGFKGVRAAEYAGIHVNRVIVGSMFAAGAIAGLAGAFEVLGLNQVHLFTEHMSSGKGYIALAALILGRWNPLGAVAACFLFGSSDAIQLQLQFTRPDIPYQLFSMLPFAAALAALVIFPGVQRTSYYRDPLCA